MPVSPQHLSRVHQEPKGSRFFKVSKEGRELTHMGRGGIQGRGTILVLSPKVCYWLFRITQKFVLQKFAAFSIRT